MGHPRVSGAPHVGLAGSSGCLDGGNFEGVGTLTKGQVDGCEATGMHKGKETELPVIQKPHGSVLLRGLSRAESISL